MTDETFDISRIPRQLLESDIHGKGAAEIGWGSDGDFDRCRTFLRAHDVPEHKIDGECATLHKKATGFWPGRGREHSCDTELFALIASAAPKSYQPIRWEGPLAPIGKPTGDGRLFPANTITYQSFPQPFRWQEQGGRGHDGAVTVGVIEHAEEGMWEGQPHIIARGYFLNPDIIPDVNKAIHQLENGVSGPSVDLDTYTAALSEHQGSQVAAVRKGRQRAATLVAIPAFADLRLKLIYPDEGEPRPFDQAPAGADAAIVAAGATFAVNPHAWKSAPIAPRNALFDADDAVSRIEDWAAGDQAKMSQAFLWINTDNGPLLGREGLRLPWADVVDGKLYLIYHAIYAAAALLEGGHGGLPHIPDEEKNRLRQVISEIYAKMSDHFGDPNMRASWDIASESTHSAETEELAGKYTEKKHPRKPHGTDEGGEWVDVPGHGPHGQILDKVTGKMVYPDKETGKIPHHGSEHKPRAKVTVRKKAPVKHPLTEAGVAAAHRDLHEGKGHVPLAQMRSRLEGTPEEQTAFLKKLDRERKIQLEPEPNRKTLTAEDHRAAVKVGGTDQHHVTMHHGKAPEATKAKVTVKKAADHKLTPAQEKYLKEGSGHPASRKVLEREGYLDSDGKLTAKGREVAGEAPKTAKVTVRKAAAHKVTASQKTTLENLHKHGPLADGNRREGVHPASLKVLEREGFVEKKGGHWELNDKGRAEIGEKVPAIKGHSTEKPKVTVRKAAPDVSAVTEKMKTLRSAPEAEKALEGLSRAQLAEVAKGMGVPIGNRDTAAQVRQAMVNHVNARGIGDAFRHALEQGEKQRADMKREPLPLKAQGMRPGGRDGAPAITSAIQAPDAAVSMRERDALVADLDSHIEDLQHRVKVGEKVTTGTGGFRKLEGQQLAAAQKDLANARKELVAAQEHRKEVAAQKVRPVGPDAYKGPRDGVEGLASAADSNFKGAKREKILAGMQGTKERIDMPDGTTVFRKAFGDKYDTPEEQQDAIRSADREELAAEVAQAIGAPVPKVYRSGPREILTDWIHGKGLDGTEEQRTKMRKALEGPDGVRLGLLDMLIGNGDRHAGNLMMDENGRIHGIDHGLSWGYASPAHTQAQMDHAIESSNRDLVGPAGDHFVTSAWGPKSYRESNPLSKADVEKLQQRLEALRPRFKALGREAWLDYSLESLKKLKPHAKGKGGIFT